MENASSSDPDPAPAIGAHTAQVWLLDGFNVLHAAMFRDRERSGWWREEDRERLLTRVCEFAEPAEEIWVVFDGSRESEPDARQLRTTGGAPVYLVFASSADDWLVRKVRGAAEPERIGVVTRDRRVGGRSRHAGASVVAPADFLGLCRAPAI